MTGHPAAPCAAIRFGTRGSRLALAQTQLVVARLRATYPGIEVAVRVIETEGDRDRVTPLTELGGRGVFTNAIEAALLHDEIDAAVHSAKDLPSVLHPDAPLVAFPDRDDPRDVLISRHGTTLGRLPASPVIGTSSRRRDVQVQRLRPDARTVSIRGNIDTRLRKAEQPPYDAIVLAAAGVRRLGLADRISEVFSVEQVTPSPGQGALAVQARAGSAAALLLAAIDDPAVSGPVRIERAFLAAIGGGCAVPVGAYATATPAGYRLVAMLADEAGDRLATIAEDLVTDDELRHAAEIAARLRAETAAEVPRQMWPGIDDEHGDLRGSRVAITRPRERAAALAAALVARGAQVVSLPAIRIEPMEETAALDAALREVQRGQFDWLAFTSANAVDVVAARCAALGIPARSLATVAVAAVGPATAAAASAAGFAVAVVPEVATAEGLLAALQSRIAPGQRVLYPRSAIGRPVLPDGLRRLGAEVVAIDVYRTGPEPDIDPAALDQVRRGQIDTVVFASPSSVRNLLALLGGDARGLRDIPVVCAGPVTARAAEEAGLRVAGVSPGPDPAAIVETIAAHWRERDGAALPRQEISDRQLAQRRAE